MAVLIDKLKRRDSNKFEEIIATPDFFVGKFVFRDTIKSMRSFLSPILVKKIVGKKVVGIPLFSIKNEDDTYTHFLPNNEDNTLSYFIKQISAYCDTLEEAAKIVETNHKVHNIHNIIDGYFDEVATTL